MVESRRNASSGIFVLVLMIVFFSFFQREKDKHNETTQSDISYTNNSSLQAIIVPEISSPGIDIFWIKKLNTKFTRLDYDSSRELILNELISNCYISYQLESHSNNPIISLIFPQKVPEQGKEDDIPSIT
jgi:hypothetical protein